MKYFIVRTMYNTYDFAKDGVVALGWEKVTFADKVNDINALIEEVRHEYYSDRKFSNQIIGRKLNEIRRFMNIQKDDVVVVPCGDSFMIGQSTGEFVTKHSRISENGHLYNQLKIDFICKDGSPLRFKRKGKNTALTTKLGCRGFTVLSITDPVIIREIDNLRKAQKDLSTSTILGHKEELEKEETVKAIHKALQNYSATSLDAHGIGFEKLIAKLFEVNGYDSYILSKQCGEDKADADILTINRSLLGDEFTTAYYIQAKHYYGNTGDYGLTQIKEYKKQLKKQAENGFIELKEKDSDQTISVDINNIRCCFITSGVFTDDVKTSASEHSIILIEGEALAKLIFDNFDKLGEFKYQLGFIKKYEQIS
jgi:hypothetical protein